jgi:undecaprenyl-diphosphatase
MSTPSRPPAAERRREPRTGPAGALTNLFFGLLRWIERHARGLYAELGLYLAIGFAATLVALLGFLGLWRLVTGGAIERVDVGILRWLREHRAPWLDAIGLLGTGLGSGIAAYLVLAVGVVVLWRSRHHLSALLLIVTLVGGRGVIGLLKTFYDRPRPALFGTEIHALGMRFDYPESASFPSGHALTAVMVFGTLAYLVARLEPTRHMRQATLLGALLLIALIGFSRVYFGVHYPSDVVAGFLAGLVWSSFCAFAIEVVAYFRPRTREPIPEEADLAAGMQPVREALRDAPATSPMEHRAPDSGMR